MARIRSIKPEAFSHRKVGRLSDRAFRLWIGCITLADDAGRLVAEPDELRVKLFGYRHLTVAQVAGALEEVVATGLMRAYRVADVLHADFPSWLDHQRICHPVPSRLPEFQPLLEDSRNFVRSLDDSRDFSTDRKGRERKGKEGMGEEGRGVGRGDFSPPTPPAPVAAVWPSPEALVALYNTHAADECPAVEKLTPARRQRALRYLRTFPAESFWRETFTASRHSRLLRGLSPSPGHTHFLATFDWYLSIGKDGAENAVKAWEGKYRD